MLVLSVRIKFISTYIKSTINVIKTVRKNSHHNFNAHSEHNDSDY